MKPLRDYQAEDVEKIFAEWKEVQSTLYVAATGLGKTRLMVEVARRMLPGRTLLLAHRNELITQAQAAFEEQGMHVEIEKAESFAESNLFSDVQVVIASVQTMLSGGDESHRMRRFDPKQFSLLLYDEAHHGISVGNKKIVDYFTKGNPKLKCLGVTATPDRTDEEALGQIFETVANERDILWANENGWLVPPMQRMIQIDDLDFSEMRTTCGDLNSADLAAVMESETSVQGVVQPTLETLFDLETGTLSDVPTAHWERFLKDFPIMHRAIVFTVSVMQAEQLSNIFNRAVPEISTWVCGKTKEQDRVEIFEQFKDGGKRNILVNVGVCTEGYDNPAVDVIVMARPTKSRSLYAQCIGRGTRPVPGLVDSHPTKEGRVHGITNSRKPCIAEGQLVLTNIGLVPIEQVTCDMQVWDGVDFVTNSGIVLRGKKPVITYAGLTATPDHNVWTEKGWKTFGECASKQIAISVTGNGRETIREADGCYRRDCSQESTKKFSLHSYGVRLRNTVMERIHQLGSIKSWMQNVWATCSFSNVVVQNMSRCSIAMHQHKRQTLSQVWRTWDQVLFRFPKSHGVMDSGASWRQDWNDNRQNRQQWPLHCGQSEVGITLPTSKQHGENNGWTGNARIQNCLSKCRIFRLPLEAFVKKKADLETNPGRALAERPIQREENVFDILNCGPRNRFTVQGLLVANCVTVLDFVGNSGRHKLICTADLLGGNTSDAAVERAIKKVKESATPVMMTQALLDAEEELKAESNARRMAEEARKARVLAKVSYSSTSVNPFDVFGLTPQKNRGWDSGKQLTEKQRDVLLKQGVDPTGMPYSAQKQVLNEIFRRFTDNLCSFKQAKLLQRNGITQKDVTREQASKLIDALAKNQWKPIGQEFVAAFLKTK